MKFSELNLHDDILKSIEASGFTEATPIQAQTIPLALAGKDVVGQAQTGTGKTAAFGLPIIQNADTNLEDVQALIISPTRELAAQTREELTKLGYDKKVKSQVVFGGSDIRQQIKNLKRNPQIVVGTPGRLIDLINRKVLKLDNLKTLVLDEADEMLDMGFVDDIEKIIKSVPNDRQTLLFSATMPKGIMKIADKFMTDPETVKVKSKELTADLVDQYYIRAKEFEKFDTMSNLINKMNPELSIIFGRTKRRVDELTRGLIARGYNAEGIHGDLSQQKRTSVLKDFKNDRLKILVATDVAARGLDISNVSHVFNFDIPQDPESYVHRIGRTGRAGKTGTSITIVSNNEMGYLKEIEELTKKRMLPLKPPTKEEALMGQVNSAIEKIDDKINNHSDELSIFKDAANDLLQKYSPEELAMVLLGVETNQDNANVKVKISSERPLPAKRSGGSGSGNRGGNRRGNSRGRSNGNRNGNRSNNSRSRNSRPGNDRKSNDNSSKKSFKIREV